MLPDNIYAEVLIVFPEPLVGGLYIALAGVAVVLAKILHQTFLGISFNAIRPDMGYYTSVCHGQDPKLFCFGGLSAMLDAPGVSFFTGSTHTADLVKWLFHRDRYFLETETFT